jgi:2'-5' RNA ligase
VPTIGVSLAVPEPWGSELQQFRIDSGDETGKLIPTHITLIPPVVLDADSLPEVEEHLVEVATRCPSYDVHLRGSGTFRPTSPVVFVNLVEGISQSEQLAWECRRGPLGIPLQFPYHPHVTVAHHLSDEQLDHAFDKMADFECIFAIEGFHLYVLDPGLGWRPSRHYPLSGVTRD